MRYLSVCSGIEAATAAWHPLGWEPVAFSEVDAFPSAVLAHHYPNTPNWGDMTRFQEWPDANIDVLVGGTPCQSFSVAGLRAGLADPRGNLMLVYLAIAARYRPQWLVWENVPGVLSSGEGRDFGALLTGLAELGYGFAYRVLDAQYFGVAQRRRRVFVVGCLGDWRRAATVLFEPESLRGDHPPSRRSRERIAGPIAGCSNGGGANGPGRTADDADSLIPVVANPLTARMGKGINMTCDEGQMMIAHALRADGFDASEDGTGRGTPLVATTLRARDQAKGVDSDCTDTLVPVAFAQNQRDEVRELEVAGALAAEPGMKQQTYISFKENMSTPSHGVDVAETLQAANFGAVAAAMAVRRLTPRECERLQGFPDDFTLIPYRGKPASDGPRYKALGNSMAVPVMAWIGKRIGAVS